MRKVVDGTMHDELLFVLAVGALHIQVVNGLPIRGKDQPRCIWAPDRYLVSGGVESKPLGATALQVISPDVGVLARDVRHAYSHGFPVRSQGHVAVHVRLAYHTHLSPLPVKPDELRKGHSATCLSNQQARIGNAKDRPFDLRLILEILSERLWLLLLSRSASDRIAARAKSCPGKTLGSLARHRPRSPWLPRRIFSRSN